MCVLVKAVVVGRLRFANTCDSLEGGCSFVDGESLRVLRGGGAFVQVLARESTRICKRSLRRLGMN